MATLREVTAQSRRIRRLADLAAPGTHARVHRDVRSIGAEQQNANDDLDDVFVAQVVRSHCRMQRLAARQQKLGAAIEANHIQHAVGRVVSVVVRILRLVLRVLTLFFVCNSRPQLE